MDNAVALFSGSPISASSISKPARKRKNNKRAKTFPEMSHATASYKVFGSFGDVECKKRRIQQVDYKNNTYSGFIQYLTGMEESVGQKISRLTDELWLSNSNEAHNKDRGLTNRKSNQNYFFQAQPESVDALQNQMANCPNVQKQQNKPSVANAEKKCQAPRSVNELSDCNPVPTNTNEVAQLDSFSLILNDIVNSASMFEPANSEVLALSQGFSVPMTMSHGFAPVLPPLTFASPLPTTMSQGQITHALSIGNHMPKNMPKELTSHASPDWNSVPQTTIKSGLLEGKTLKQRSSSSLTTNSVQVTPLASRNSVSITSSHPPPGNQSQQFNNSVQWSSNHSDLKQPNHSVKLDRPEGQPTSSAHFSPSRDFLIKSFNCQPKQKQEEVKRILKKRMLKERIGYMPSLDTFQEMFEQATNSIMPAACTQVESTYTRAATEKPASIHHYTSSRPNYTEAQSTYSTEKSINTGSASIPPVYSHLSNTQLLNIQASFRQSTNTESSNSQLGYNQPTNTQPDFGLATKTQPAIYPLAHSLPSNSQASNIVTSLRKTDNTPPRNPQSVNKQISHLQSTIRQTNDTQLTNPQSVNNQAANVQSAFRQTNNRHFAKCQSTPTPDSDLSDLQASFRPAADSQTSNIQSAYTQAAHPSFIHTTINQPTLPQLSYAYTQTSSTQISNLQTSFRQTTNTQPANPQHAYFPESSTTDQPAAITTQEPMDFLMTPPPYTSTSNYFIATISDSPSAQFKTQNFENGLLSDLNTPTMKSSTPDFTSLTNMESFTLSPKAEEEDLLSSNNDSFYLSSIPSICFT